MEDATLFVGVKLKNPKDMDITEHLSMNGYTFDTNAVDVIFIYIEELSYLKTVLEDHNISYEIM